MARHTATPFAKAFTDRIHLGLDLRGGVHLILKVKVGEAVATETDNTVGRIQQDLKTANLGFTQVYKPDPTKPELVKVEGVTPANASAVRSALDNKYSNEYDIAGSGTDGILHADDEAIDRVGAGREDGSAGD
jgi:preprotein translocase subunit SecD